LFFFYPFSWPFFLEASFFAFVRSRPNYTQNIRTLQMIVSVNDHRIPPRRRAEYTQTSRTSFVPWAAVGGGSKKTLMYCILRGDIRIERVGG
jgi:hypothetical protein